MSNVPRLLSVALCVLLVASCSQAPPPQASAPKPTPAAVPTPTPAPAPAGSAQRAFSDSVLGSKKPQAPAPPDDDEEEGVKPVKKIETITDPSTGQRLLRVPKDPTLVERDGSLFSANVPTQTGVPIVRQDAENFYVAAPTPPTPEEIAKKRAEKEAADAALPQILELPKEEAEIVTPKISKKKILLESHSAGLPKGGIWRENFALADIDGDGRPEIISPPPRLSGEGLRIFKWDGERWRSVTPQLENPESLHIGYGAIATGDLDGDGRTDIVWGGHGGGVWAGRNLGDMKFRLSRNGLSGEISTRALAVGDLDGDGKPDVLVLSDMPEAAAVDKPRARPSGYIEGYDVRAYINKGDRFVELVAGLEDKPCYGYSIGLETRPADKGAPFATSCNYSMGVNLLYEFDRGAMSFRNVSGGVVELFSVGMGAAVGTYHGHPAAFTSYFKNRPAGGLPDPTGDGLSIYYRDGKEWKRHRVLKRLGSNRGISPGIAVADLDGDGLDDIVVADRVTNKVRVFFQTPAGEFEELDPALEPSFVNFPTAIRIADVDGDGRPDIVLMLQYMTVSETKEGGFRFFRNLPSK